MTFGFITQQSVVQLAPGSADGKHSRITSVVSFIVPSGRLLLLKPGRGKHPVALAIFQILFREETQLHAVMVAPMVIAQLVSQIRFI